MYRYAEYNGGITREQFLFYEMKDAVSFFQNFASGFI